MYTMGLSNEITLVVAKAVTGEIVNILMTWLQGIIYFVGSFNDVYVMSGSVYVSLLCSLIVTI